MKYSTYKEDYLEDQIQLVTKVTKDWFGFGYPNSAEQLKEVYSRETFTPDTRHYLYDNDKLVGFIASAVENKEGEIQYGSIQYPFVDAGNDEERLKLEQKLLKKATETLKEKGVNIIRSTFNDDWPISSFKSMYEEKQAVQRAAIMENFMKYASTPTSPNIVAMDMEKHIQAFHKGVTKQFPDMTEEQMIEILKRAQEGPGHLKRLLAIENDMVVAQGRIGTFENESDNSVNAFLIIFAYHEDGVKYKAEIIKGLLKELEGKEIKELRLTHTYSDADPESGFDEFNLNFSAFRLYEINL
ncbi:MAG: hypothetical protein INQ03_21155 [Candidatus Heimdallarchaeota archaeon]|nr:hypothetical protein [Candidatus Heimdallarchaeota archaeon]